MKAEWRREGEKQAGREGGGVGVVTCLITRTTVSLGKKSIWYEINDKNYYRFSKQDIQREIILILGVSTILDDCHHHVHKGV